mgnify:FL=1
MFADFINKFYVSKKTNNKYVVGQKVLSKHNGSLCSIKREIKINNIRHFELCMENDVTKREIILSEYALNTNYKNE